MDIGHDGWDERWTKEVKEKNLTVKGCLWVSLISFLQVFRYSLKLASRRVIKAKICDVLAHVFRIDAFRPITEHVWAIMLYKIKFWTKKSKNNNYKNRIIGFTKELNEEWVWQNRQENNEQRRHRRFEILPINVILTEIRCNQWLISVQVNSVVGFISMLTTMRAHTKHTSVL